MKVKLVEMTTESINEIEGIRFIFILVSEQPTITTMNIQLDDFNPAMILQQILGSVKTMYSTSPKLILNIWMSNDDVEKIETDFRINGIYEIEYQTHGMRILRSSEDGE
ncbi:MAG: hypothetical protein QXV17_07825 [Candidatus Micrarchaeaceae archaeon]